MQHSSCIDGQKFLPGRTNSLHEFLSHQFYSFPVIDPECVNGITFRLKPILQHSPNIGMQCTLLPPTSSLHELLSHQFYSSLVVYPQSPLWTVLFNHVSTFRLKAMLQHFICISGYESNSPSFSFVNLVYWLTTGVKCRYKAPVNRISDNNIAKFAIMNFIFLLNFK